MTAASLAVGASRWQTLWRVVLPSASPGIFAALMIGFGRAVGETMIVLMATGNTPIIDWSPFNGMRTLSANIAVEIPEAPVGGTLYLDLDLDVRIEPVERLGPVGHQVVERVGANAVQLAVDPGNLHVAGDRSGRVCGKCLPGRNCHASAAHQDRCGLPKSKPSHREPS
jgi:hypothetical protein